MMTEKIKIVDYARRENKIKKALLLSIGFYLFFFFITFVLYLNFSYMGAKNKAIENLIFANFKWLLAWSSIKIFIVYLIIGLIVGIFTLLLKIAKKRFILLFNFFFMFMFWVYGIKIYPQMYNEQLFRRGGLLKYFQIFITDYVPLVVIFAVFIVTVVAVAIKQKRLVYVLPVILLPCLLILRFDVAPVKAGSEHPATPNVLVFATDSLRPDFISYNGYKRKTPTIDRLFAKGVNFSNLKSSMARTLPAWTTIFTSTLPPDHRMRHMFPNKKKMQKNWITFVDILNQHKYYTAVVSDFAGDIFPSINYGFQDVVSPELSIQEVLKQRSLEIHYFALGFLMNPLGRSVFPEMWGMALNKDPWYVTRAAKQSIKKAIKSKHPFFVLSFSSSNHFPYVTKYPYYQMYTPRAYTGEHKYGLSAEVLESFLEKPLSPAAVSRVIDHYDSATKLFDDNLAEILTYLKECHVEKNTIVIIMSDHGENLYEEDYGIGHGDHLLGAYSTSMTFGVYSPFENFSGRRIAKTTRDIDIAPTILNMLNLEIPAAFKGISLLPVMRGAQFSGYPVYMETGIWYSVTTPFIKNRIRIPYPVITEMADIEMPSGKIFLKDQYEKTVLQAKYKAYQLNEKKYIYMPGLTEYKEAFYINEKQVLRQDITDPDFLSFKQKMVDMFKGKFFIDQNGFIREFITKQP